MQRWVAHSSSIANDTTPNTHTMFIKQPAPPPKGHAHITRLCRLPPDADPGVFSTGTSPCAGGLSLHAREDMEVYVGVFQHPTTGLH